MSALVECYFCVQAGKTKKSHYFFSANLMTFFVSTNTHKKKKEISAINLRVTVHITRYNTVAQNILVVLLVKTLL